MQGEVARLLKLVALAHVPAARCDDLLAVGQDGQMIDDRVVGPGPGYELTGLGVPQAERLVKTAAHQVPAVGREGQAGDAALMREEGLPRRAGGSVAQVNRSFAVGCSDLRAVWRE